MPYYEIETDVVARLFIKADSFYHCMNLVMGLGIDDDNICSITRVHYNMVIV